MATDEMKCQKCDREMWVPYINQEGEKVCWYCLPQDDWRRPDYQQEKFRVCDKQ